jgi:hypothetical protein
VLDAVVVVLVSSGGVLSFTAVGVVEAWLPACAARSFAGAEKTRRHAGQTKTPAGELATAGPVTISFCEDPSSLDDKREYWESSGECGGL